MTASELAGDSQVTRRFSCALNLLNAAVDAIGRHRHVRGIVGNCSPDVNARTYVGFNSFRCIYH